MKVQDIIDFAYLSKLSVNRDETHFAYLKSKANLEKNDYEHELHISDGENFWKAITLDNSTHYFWETNKSILIPFLKDNNTTELFKYDLERKTFQSFHSLPIPINHIDVISEELWIIQTSLSIDEHLLYEDSANRKDYLKDYTHFEEVTSIPFYRDGGTFTRNKLTQVLLYNPKLETFERIFDKDINITMCEFNPYTQKLYLLVQKDNKVLSLYNDAYTYDINSKKLTEEYSNKEITIRRFIEINNHYYLFGTDMKDHGLNQNNQIYKLSNGKISLFLPFGKSSYNSTGSDVRLLGSQTSYIFKDKYMFIGTYQDRTVLYKFDGKQITKEFSPKGSIDGWIRFKNKYFGIGLFDHQPQELYELMLIDNTYHQITSYNKQSIQNKYVSKPIYHSFTDSDHSLDGWVLLPENYDENKSYPAILQIHGGPKTIYNENFFHEMQVFVNEGYIVFFCNPRGGDSYDDVFADIRGQYGTVDFDDIMWFTDFVLENYAVDENNVGIMGGSYGGFMTNWIVSHTDRFKAAITQRSISNWISFYGTSDIGYYFGPDQTQADPIDDFEKAWEQSPLKYAKNIKTPLLFMHSDKDYRCPIEQALQLYTVIKKNGVDTKLIWFKDENHNLSRGGRPKSRIKRLDEMLNWMNHYLKEHV